MRFSHLLRKNLIRCSQNVGTRQNAQCKSVTNFNDFVENTVIWICVRKVNVRNVILNLYADNSFPVIIV